MSQSAGNALQLHGALTWSLASKFGLSGSHDLGCVELRVEIEIKHPAHAQRLTDGAIQELRRPRLTSTNIAFRPNPMAMAGVATTVQLL